MKAIFILFTTILLVSCSKTNTDTSNVKSSAIVGTWVFNEQSITDPLGNFILGYGNSNDTVRVVFNTNNTMSYTYPVVAPNSSYYWVTEKGTYNFLSDSVFTVSTAKDTGFLKLVYGYLPYTYINGVDVSTTNFATFNWPYGDSILITKLTADTLAIHQSKYKYVGTYTSFVKK